MSTSLLDHAFGIRGYDYVRTDYQDGQVIFSIAQDPADCRCSAWGCREVISRGHLGRRFRSRPIRAQIAAVAMDMSGAYRSAVATHLPKAKIVFDHFPVIKLFNDKLSDLRRELDREATDVLHKEVLKGTRWLLLKNPENLDAK